MNAVVMEIRGDSVVALKTDGTFEYIKMRGCTVGQTVRLAPRRAYRRVWRRIVSCAAVLLLLGSSGVLAVNVPVSYVTLDVNPSFKYTLNIFSGVIKAEAVNTDAGPIVAHLNDAGIIYRSIDEVISLTVADCRENGYLYTDKQDYIVLSVASGLTGQTAEIAERLTKEAGEDVLLSVKVVETSIDEIKSAEEKGTTPGKLEIIQEMQSSTGDTADEDQWIDKTVRDIMAAIPGSHESEDTLDQPSSKPDGAGTGTTADDTTNQSSGTTPDTVSGNGQSSAPQPSADTVPADAFPQPSGADVGAAPSSQVAGSELQPPNGNQNPQSHQQGAMPQSPIG